MQTLIVAALEEEIQTFPASVRYSAWVTGSGKLQGALGLIEGVRRYDPERVIVVGTAGALRDDITPGVYTIGAACQHDYTPIDLGATPPDWIYFPTEGLSIATGDSFISDSATRDRLAKFSHLVDMETYAYAMACRPPLTVYKAVSDQASEGAEVDWEKSLRWCSNELWKSVEWQL